MEAARHLRAVDQHGEIADLDVAGLQHELEQTKAELELLQQDFLKKLAEIRRLKADKERERKSYVWRETVERIFDYWREACRHPNSKLTGDRFDAVRWALDSGYTEAQIMLAIDGAAFDPFVTRQRNGRMKRHDDLALLNEGKRIEAWACKAPRPVERRREPVVARWLDGETWGVVPFLLDREERPEAFACKAPRGERP
jgi:hypothetical protein